jgi:NAD(P)H-hydrate epimerase
MASGGTGDVLTGIIVSLIGQGMESYDAAICGAYVHGLAGDISAGKKVHGNIIASDIIEALPEAMNAL